MTAALAGALALGTLAACADNGGSSNAGTGQDVEVLARTAAPGAAQTDLGLDRLDVGVPGTVPSLNPLGDIGSGLYVDSLALESLLRVNRDGELEPWLASDWEQVSDTVYEYTLREGVTFWDGSELTAEDVKFSWEKRIETASQFFAPIIESIDTPDDYTVRVTLQKPNAAWQYTPALFYSNIFQKDFYEENEKTFGQPGTLVMGTGPWEITDLNPTSGMELVAHEEYWGGTPPIGEISVRFFSEDNGMALALRGGEIDFAPFVNAPRAFDSAAGGDTVTTASTCASAFLSMNTLESPWDEVEVRRAVAYALNRDDIIAATQGRAGDRLDYMISPILLAPLGTEEEVQAALEPVETYDYDLEKARAALAESSVPDGFEAEIVTIPTYREVTQVVAAQLREIGIDLEIKPITDAEFGTAITTPEDRPLTFTETGGCAPDPSWDDIWLGDSILNIANYTPQDVGDLLLEGVATTDPAERLETYTQILERLAKDVPYVPLYEEGATYASKDFDMTDFGSFWQSSPWALNLVER